MSLTVTNFSAIVRLAVFLAPLTACLFGIGGPARAQGIYIIRDSEIERVLRGYEDPILKVAGIDRHTIKIYLVNDPEINAFATQSPIPGE